MATSAEYGREWRRKNRVRAYELKKQWRARNPLYVVWSEMIARCTSPNHRVYMRYGGRGIGVCDRWRGPAGYANFITDMGERPSARHTLERRDNNAGYEPANCVWATSTQQNRNRRNTLMLTLNGETKPAMEWAEQYGLKRHHVYLRLKHGWSVERVLTQPLEIHRRKCA